MVNASAKTRQRQNPTPVRRDILKPTVLLRFRIKSDEELDTVAQDVDSRDSAATERFWTLPNMVTGVRIILSPVLVVLALADEPLWMGGLAGFLVFTEWLDGFLARRLQIVSKSGARLDSIADALFYSSLLAAVVCLAPELVAKETPWIVAAVVSYALSWFASWIKFRRLPSYHTWSAKGSWIVVGAGIVCLLTGWSVWPFRIAMLCVVLANLEAIAITWLLPECQVDVPSIWHARNGLRQDGS